MTERINAQQVAWLVESEPGGLWWDGRFVSRGIDPRFFTRDPNEAIRFARREDAEKVAASSSALKATEHVWMAAQPQQAADKEFDADDMQEQWTAGFNEGMETERARNAPSEDAQPQQAAEPAPDGAWDAARTMANSSPQDFVRGAQWAMAQRRQK